MRFALSGLLTICVMSACTSQPGSPVLSAASSAPASSGASAAQQITRIINFQTPDGKRTAQIHHPAHVRPGAPLIVVLHTATVSAADTETTYGWDTIADRYEVVVAYPDGLLDGFQDTWSGGHCCPPASQLKTDDVRFLDKLATALRLLDRVGANIYAVGFSNGGIMAYAWACAEPGELAGIGIVAGALMVDCPAPAPINLVAVHGAVDPTIPIVGGPGPDGAIFPSLQRSLASFRSADKCAAHTGVMQKYPAEVTTWSCARGLRVVLDVVTGLGHSWPGAGPTAGATDCPLDATGLLWAHLRPTA